MSTPYGISTSKGSSVYSSYLNTPIRAPLSTNQYPFSMAYHNFGVLNGQRPTPPLFYPSQEPVYSDMNTNARSQYVRATGFSKETLALQKALGKESRPTSKVSYSSERQFGVSTHMNYIQPLDSSMHLNIKKSVAVGKSSYKVGLPVEAPTCSKSYYPSGTRSSLQRARSGGCTAPKKKGSIYNTFGCSVVSYPDYNVLPVAPINLSAIVDVGSVSIYFTQPVNNGGPILNYEYDLIDLTRGTFLPFNPPQNRSPVLITGLEDGVTYSVVLRAVNKNGAGPSSSTVIFTTPDIPDAPTNLSVIPGDSEVYVYFTEPSDGGSEITNYEYSLDDGLTWSLFSPPVTESPVTINSLSNGTIYTIRLTAVNAVGPSNNSDSVSVAPIPINSFNPSEISGLNVWLDGQYPASIDLSSNKVDTWKDRSGQNNNFTKGNNNVISYAVPSGINNRPALNFVDSYTNLEREFNIAPSNQLSLFMVVYHTSNGSGNSELFFTINDYRYFDLFSNTNNPQGLLSFNIGNTTQVSSGVNIRGSIALISMIVTSTVDLYVNGTQTNNNVARGGLSLNNTLTWSISAGAFRGFIGEIVTYPSGLSDVDRQRIEGYLAWKWGLQENLPDNQPYKSAPPIVLDAPVITGITGGFQTLSLEFTQNTNGQTITNYLYSTDNGVTFRELATPDTTSPLTITTLSSDGTSPLTNGVTYDVKIQAKTANGLSPLSNSVQGTPDITSIVSFKNVGSTTWTAPANVTSVEYLVVGGGGGSGGGFDTGGGGGGGGGMVLSGTLSVIPGDTYNIVVGDGGAGGISIRNPVSETNGIAGDNSEFNAIVALGGGGGYASRSSNSGGSSAGGTSVSGVSASIGGSGGGNASDGNGAGGGGGNTTNGSNGVSNTGGNGGLGISNSITGTSVVYGAGGRGANGNTTYESVPGLANTGNGAVGGGGASFVQRNGAKGGSGIVILKYTPSLPAPGAPTLTYALAGNTQAYIYFTKDPLTPSEDISNYEYTTNGGTTWNALSPADPNTPILITGLTNGTTYNIGLRAINLFVPSASSNTISVTPQAGTSPVESLYYDPNNSSSYSGSGTTVANVGSFGTLNGTMVGPSFVTGTGIARNVFDFNGDSTRIEFGQYDFGSSFTISAWVYPKEQYSINGLITNTSAGLQTDGFKLGWNFWETENRTMLFEAGNGGEGGAVGSLENTVVVNSWQYLTYIVDVANQRALFLRNGIPVDSFIVPFNPNNISDNTTVPNIGTNNPNFNIGSFTDTSYAMNAELGYIKVYNGVLSVGDIQDDYNNSKASFGL